MRLPAAPEVLPLRQVADGNRIIVNNLKIMNTIPLHIPVLLSECLDILEPVLSQSGSVFIDGTLGLGGHAQAVLERFQNTRVIGIDRDDTAIGHATSRLSQYGRRFIGVHTTYENFETALQTADEKSANGILLDLGISSMQIDEPERGFSYSTDAPLDMRMDQSKGLTASEIINEYSVTELENIFRTLGEEKLSARYAAAIDKARALEPIKRSARLVEILNDATPYALRNSGHPAKRVFQALRIEVNSELEILREAIHNALAVLAPGGRLLVLSYHSLEDRIVKTAFAEATKVKAPLDLPVIPEGLKPAFRLVFAGSKKASDSEISSNSRSASVRFRAIERIGANR